MLGTMQPIPMPSIACVIEAVGNQELVAKECNVTPGTVSHWSTGRHGIDPIHYRKLAELSKGQKTAVDFTNDEIERRKTLRDRKKKPAAVARRTSGRAAVSATN